MNRHLSAIEPTTDAGVPPPHLPSARWDTRECRLYVVSTRMTSFRETYVSRTDCCIFLVDATLKKQNSAVQVFSVHMGMG